MDQQTNKQAKKMERRPKSIKDDEVEHVSIYNCCKLCRIMRGVHNDNWRKCLIKATRIQFEFMKTANTFSRYTLFFCKNVEDEIN